MSIKIKMKANAKKPNFVIVLTDDQGYGDLGLFGNPHISTPRIDALADHGVKLTQHYSGAPLCAPARAALLTGRYHNRTGALSVESNRGMDRIGLREVTMADYFKSKGYVTGLIGKWHNGLFDTRYHPNSRGFEEFFGFLNGGMDYYHWIVQKNGVTEKTDGRYLTDVFASQAVDFIDRHKNENFMLYVTFNAPHSPLQAPDEEVKPFLEKGIFNRNVCNIYGMISRLDKAVGNIVDKLKKEGLFDNTVILYTSDNGPWLGTEEGQSCMRFNGPFGGMKNYVLEGGIRVPAIISWPDGLPGQSCADDMTHFVDWLPTFIAAAGLDIDPALPFDGINILPLLRKEENPATHRKLFWQHNRNEPVRNCNAAMRDGPWKLVWPYPEDARYKSQEDNDWYHKLFCEPHFNDESICRSYLLQEVTEIEKPALYNIVDDPCESVNLFDIYTRKATQMKNELEQWFEIVEEDRNNNKDLQVMER